MFRRTKFVAALAANMAFSFSVMFAQGPADIVWRSGMRLERQLAAPGTDEFRIPLMDRQLIRIEVLQKGSDLAVSFRDPQGRLLVDVDSLNGRYGPERVAAIAETAGDYRLEIKDGNYRGSSNYELKVLDLRDAIASDGNLIAAYRDYVEGLQLRRARTAQARQQATQKLGLAREFFRTSGDPYMDGLTLYSLAVVLGDSAEFRKALPLYEESELLFASIGDSLMQARALNNAAGALDVLGELEKALSYYRQALPAYVAVGDSGGQANLLNNIASSESTLSNWQGALRDFQEALTLSRQSGNPRLEGLVLNQTGLVYRKLGETERALTLFQQALPLRRMAADKGGEVTTLQNLAETQRSMHQPTKSLEYLEASLEPARSIGDRLLEARSLRSQGAAYTDLQRYAEAQDSLLRALDLARAIQDRHTTGEVLVNLARSSLLASQPQKAAEWSAQALIEFVAVGDPSYEAIALEIAAMAEDARGNLRESRRLIEGALRVTEEARKGTDSQQLRASFFATRQDAYAFYVDLLMRTGETALALEANERSHARSLVEMLTDSGMDIREGVDAKLLAREREISDLLNAKGARLLNSPRSADLLQEIRELEGEYQDVQGAIRKSSPRYDALVHPEPLKLAAIQRELLDEDTLLLEYSLGEKRSYLWAVGKYEIHSWELPPRDMIERQAESVSELLTARSAAPRLEIPAERQKRIAEADAALPVASRKLSEMILVPAAGVLKNRKLAVVPDGALQRLPFAMLPLAVGRGSEPLIVSHEVVMLPSASALAALRGQIAGRKPASKMVAVFADPVFDGTDPRAGRTTVSPPASLEASRILEHLAESGDGQAVALKIPRLPYTAQEADQILSVARGASNLKAVGLDATRAAATNGQLNDYRYIHFATHGYLDTERPSLSALVLSQFDENRQPQDGFLRVNDIYNARLTADLVVLSACQTGLGKEVRGEGLMGLTRAFLYAGVPRVIVSLWNVNDRATADLMANLYRKLLREGKRPAASLREAQLEMRKQKQWESPYYWAAFVQHGDWR